ncbi:MAG: type II toxin-antitoxin system RelE/ParE family toxin [Nitrospirota bacterium]
MRRFVWTRRAIEDTQAIKAFIERDSPHSAELVVTRIIAAVDQLPAFPESGRVVPEYREPTIRKIIRPPYPLQPIRISFLTLRFKPPMHP